MSSTTEDQADDPIRRAAAAALADVNALSAEGEDRTIILEAVLRARLGGHVPAAPAVAPAPAAGNGTTPPAAPEGPGRGDVIDKIGAVLGVDRDTLELFYSVQDGEPRLHVSSKKIASQKAEGARQLARLVAAARQAAGLEEWTLLSSIRPVVQDYGKLDSGNYASAMQALDDVAVFRGKGPQREIKITKPGMEKVADMIRTLAGADS